MEQIAPLRLAVLISGSGMTLVNLVQQIRDGQLDCIIKIVIASRGDIKGIERAKDAGLSFEVIDPRHHPDAEALSEKVFSTAAIHDVDLVCLAGWLVSIESAASLDRPGDERSPHRCCQALAEKECTVVVSTRRCLSRAAPPAVARCILWMMNTTRERFSCNVPARFFPATQQFPWRPACLKKRRSPIRTRSGFSKIRSIKQRPFDSSANTANHLGMPQPKSISPAICGGIISKVN